MYSDGNLVIPKTDFMARRNLIYTVGLTKATIKVEDNLFYFTSH